MSLPTSTPNVPAAMFPDSRPSQSEANDEINNWLASGLQSYVEEGQRMRDAADGISPVKHSVTLRNTAHTMSGHKEHQRPLSPEPHIRTTSEPRRDDNEDTLPRVHEILRNAQVERHIIIKGEGHNIHLNIGPGQQNVYYGRSGDDRDNHDDDGYGNEGYDDDYDNGNDQDNGQGHDLRYRQPESDCDGCNNTRYDAGYNGYTRGRDVRPCECRECQGDIHDKDGISYVCYSYW